MRTFIVSLYKNFFLLKCCAIDCYLLIILKVLSVNVKLVLKSFFISLILQRKALLKVIFFLCSRYYHFSSIDYLLIIGFNSASYNPTKINFSHRRYVHLYSWVSFNSANKSVITIILDETKFTRRERRLSLALMCCIK